MEQPNENQQQQQQITKIQQIVNIIEENQYLQNDELKNRLQDLLLSQFSPLEQMTSVQSDPKEENFNLLDKFIQLISLKIYKKGEFIYHDRQYINDITLILKGDVLQWQKKQDQDINHEIELTKQLQKMQKSHRQAENLPETQFFKDQIDKINSQLFYLRDSEYDYMLQNTQKRYSILPNITGYKKIGILKKDTILGDIEAYNRACIQQSYQILSEDCIVLQIEQNKFLKYFSENVQKIIFILQILTNNLPNADLQSLKWLAYTSETQIFYNDHVIFNENEAVDSMYIIREGNVEMSRKIIVDTLNQLRIQRSQTKTKEIQLQLLFKGAFFGIENLLYKNSFRFYKSVTKCPTQTILYRIKKKNIDYIIAENFDESLSNNIMKLSKIKIDWLQQQSHKVEDFNQEQITQQNIRRFSIRTDIQDKQILGNMVNQILAEKKQINNGQQIKNQNLNKNSNNNNKEDIENQSNSSNEKIESNQIILEDSNCSEDSEQIQQQQQKQKKSQQKQQESKKYSLKNLPSQNSDQESSYYSDSYSQNNENLDIKQPSQANLQNKNNVQTFRSMHFLNYSPSKGQKNSNQQQYFQSNFRNSNLNFQDEITQFQQNGNTYIIDQNKVFFRNLKNSSSKKGQFQKLFEKSKEQVPLEILKTQFFNSSSQPLFVQSQNDLNQAEKIILSKTQKLDKKPQVQKQNKLSTVQQIISNLKKKQENDQSLAKSFIEDNNSYVDIKNGRGNISYINNTNSNTNSSLIQIQNNSQNNQKFLTPIRKHEKMNKSYIMQNKYYTSPKKKYLEDQKHENYNNFNKSNVLQNTLQDLDFKNEIKTQNTLTSEFQFKEIPMQVKRKDSNSVDNNTSNSNLYRTFNSKSPQKSENLININENSKNCTFNNLNNSSPSKYYKNKSFKIPSIFTLQNSKKETPRYQKLISQSSYFSNKQCQSANTQSQKKYQMNKSNFLKQSMLLSPQTNKKSHFNTTEQNSQNFDNKQKIKESSSLEVLDKINFNQNTNNNNKSKNKQYQQQQQKLYKGMTLQEQLQIFNQKSNSVQSLQNFSEIKEDKKQQTEIKIENQSKQQKIIQNEKIQDIINEKLRILNQKNELFNQNLKKNQFQYTNYKKQYSSLIEDIEEQNINNFYDRGNDKYFKKKLQSDLKIINKTTINNNESNNLSDKQFINKSLSYPININQNTRKNQNIIKNQNEKNLQIENQNINKRKNLKKSYFL